MWLIFHLDHIYNKLVEMSFTSFVFVFVPHCIYICICTLLNFYLYLYSIVRTLITTSWSRSAFTASLLSGHGKWLYGSIWGWWRSSDWWSESDWSSFDLLRLKLPLTDSCGSFSILSHLTLGPVELMNLPKRFLNPSKSWASKSKSKSKSWASKC